MTTDRIWMTIELTAQLSCDGIWLRYRAEDAAESLLLSVLDPKLAWLPDREARAAFRQLAGPYCVAISEPDEPLVWWAIRDPGLQPLVQSDEPLAAESVARVVLELGRQLQQPHGWLSPTALWSTPDGRLVLDPPGTRRLLSAFIGANTPKPNPLLELHPQLLNQLGARLLSSPESDTTDDRFAVGALAFRLLTGKAPYLRDSFLATAAAISRRSLAGEWDPAPAPEIERFIRGALAEGQPGIPELLKSLELLAGEFPPQTAAKSGLISCSLTEQLDRLRPGIPRRSFRPADSPEVVADEPVDPAQKVAQMQLMLLESQLGKPKPKNARMVIGLVLIGLVVMITLPFVVAKWPKANNSSPKSPKMRQLSPDEVEQLRQRDRERRDIVNPSDSKTN